jgi:hypothetical protein
MLRWARCGFHKKHAETSYSERMFLHSLGSAGHVVNSGASGLGNIDALSFMLGWDRYGINKKGHRETLLRTCVLAPDGICGSHSAV